MTRAVLITGGNIGDMATTLASALDMIAQKVGTVVACSQVHYTPSWGFESEQEFGNQVIVVDTELTASRLLETIWQIEKDNGRNRKIEAQTKKEDQRYASRTLDIDILFYGDQTINNQDLIVPHRLMHEREFVLKPLAEVMPNYCHPFFGVSVARLLNNIYLKK